MLLLILCAVLPGLMAVPVRAGPAPAPEHRSRIVVPADATFPMAAATRIGVDKSMIVELPVTLGNVLVSNPDVLDAVVQTANRVYLIAKKTGQANAFFFDDAGNQILTLEVSIQQDHTQLRDMLERMFPGTEIVIDGANDNIVLRGRVHKASEAARAADIASGFLPNGKKLINMLEVDTKEQVMLRVTVAEMQREVIKRLGVNWNGAHVGDAGIGGGTNNAFPISSGVGSNSFLFGVFGPKEDLGACLIPGLANGVLSPPGSLAGAGSISCLARSLEAFERNGLVRTLAEPKLTAISGETASFLAGGEFPVPVSQSSSNGNNTITVDWKQFGVGLSFTPVVISEERISMKIATEVSELTSEGAVQVDSISLPGLSVRRTSTTIELPSGGSLVLAGLLSDNTKQNIDGLPGLKDLPILGTLFRSTDYRKKESELVIIVTPLLIQPAARSDLARPDDNFMPDADLNTFLMGSFNRRYGKADAPPEGGYKGDFGFILK